MVKTEMKAYRHSEPSISMRIDDLSKRKGAHDVVW
jgi:hypothetical protein